VAFGGRGGDDDDSEEVDVVSSFVQTTNVDSRLLFCYTLYAAVMAFLDNRRGYSGKNSGAQTAV